MIQLINFIKVCFCILAVGIPIILIISFKNSNANEKKVNSEDEDAYRVHNDPISDKDPRVASKGYNLFNNPSGEFDFSSTGNCRPFDCFDDNGDFVIDVDSLSADIGDDIDLQIQEIKDDHTYNISNSPNSQKMYYNSVTDAINGTVTKTKLRLSEERFCLRSYYQAKIDFDYFRYKDIIYYHNLKDFHKYMTNSGFYNKNDASTPFQDSKQCVRNETKLSLSEVEEQLNHYEPMYKDIPFVNEINKDRKTFIKYFVQSQSCDYANQRFCVQNCKTNDATNFCSFQRDLVKADDREGITPNEIQESLNNFSFN